MINAPVVLEDFQLLANEKLDQNAKNYFMSGADGEQTLSENCKAFDRLRIRPKTMRGISGVNMETKVFGERVNMPICVAPAAMQQMAHHDGEVAVAKAVQSMGTSMGVSTFSTFSYKDIAEAAPNAVYFMQLYIYKDYKMSEWLIKHAESAGYKAIALTVDTPLIGQRLADVRHQFKLPAHIKLANVENYFDAEGGDAGEKERMESGLMTYVCQQIEAKISWDSVKWIRSVTKLPIYLKGILTREDALETLNHDVQGIIVSNHGGRQLDGVPASIEALPEVVKAVNGKVDVLFDGGIRRGTDVFKALALGAKAVFIGRPLLWGLSYDGERGVEKVLQILKDEFERAMMLAGCATIDEIVPAMVVHESHYWNLAKL